MHLRLVAGPDHLLLGDKGVLLLLEQLIHDLFGVCYKLLGVQIFVLFQAVGQCFDQILRLVRLVHERESLGGTELLPDPL